MKIKGVNTVIMIRVIINAYERNAKARAACIAHHGLTCAACGFNFDEVYGSLGAGFIHVHHIVPIGSIGDEYEVNPVDDLIPVCPNCHAVIHRTEPPLSVEQLRSHLGDKPNWHNSSAQSARRARAKAKQ